MTIWLLERQAAGDLVQERELAKAGVTNQSGPAQNNNYTDEYIVSGTIDVEGTKRILTAKLTKSAISKPLGVNCRQNRSTRIIGKNCEWIFESNKACPVQGFVWNCDLGHCIAISRGR